MASSVSLAQEDVSPVEACYNKANFYYHVALTRDSGIPRVDLEMYFKRLAVQTDIPLSLLDKYIEAIVYVYSVNSTPKQVASGVFQECLTPSTRT